LSSFVVALFRVFADAAISCQPSLPSSPSDAVHYISLLVITLAAVVTRFRWKITPCAFADIAMICRRTAMPGYDSSY